MRKYILYALVFVFALLSGWFMMAYLTVHPLRMSFYLILTLLTFSGTVIGLIYIPARKRKPILVLLSLAIFLSGYLLHAGKFLNQEDSRLIPELARQSGYPVCTLYRPPGLYLHASKQIP